MTTRRIALGHWIWIWIVATAWLAAVMVLRGCG